MHQQRAMRVNFLPAESQFELCMALISRSVAASYMIGPRWESVYGGNCDSIPLTLATSPRLCGTARA